MNIISRKQAKGDGKAHYYTGKPCIRGHDSVRYTASGNCRLCKNEKSSHNPALHGDGNGLKCPYCESQRLRVVCVRPHRGTNRRRRECRSCKQRFWTIEILSNWNADIADTSHPEDY